MNDPLVAALQEENSALKAKLLALQVEWDVMLRQHAAQLYARDLLVEKLEAEQRLARAQRFGASSEQGDHQARLFDEAEFAVREAPVEPETVEVAAHTKKKPCRAVLPAELPRVVVEHPLVSATCGCGAELTRIEPVVSEQLDVIPARVFVVQHVRHRGVCRQCDTAPVTAPLPAQPIPKSLASPGLLAFTATSKYADGLPLYRQSAMFERMKIALPRQTLAGHMVAAGELITPLVNLLTDHVLAGDILGIDETRVQVLKEPGRAAERLSTMWVMRGGPPGRVALRFEYNVSRGKAVANRLLEGYRGYLQRDGYAAYKEVSARPEITGVGCWAHVRRKFLDALKAMPAKEQSKGNRTQQALAFIGALYGIEQRIADKPPEERKTTRHTDAIPLLERFKTWLDQQPVTPSGLLGKAIHYTRGEWPYLTTYCQDGRLSIDNNRVENAIRPFAVGRKNWLFSDTQHGAVASANLYSLIETARANALNPYAYLKLVFSELPLAQTVDAIEALLPWNIDADKLDVMLQVPTFVEREGVG